MSWERGVSQRSSNLPSDWKRTRRRILRRDNGVCYVCGDPGANGVDHIVPHSQGGSDDDENLAAIHERPCHAQKSSREGRAAQPKQRRERDPNPGLI